MFVLHESFHRIYFIRNTQQYNNLDKKCACDRKGRRVHYIYLTQAVAYIFNLRREYLYLVGGMIFGVFLFRRKCLCLCHSVIESTNIKP